MSVLNHGPTPLLDPTPENLWRAAACIRQGGVVVVPSDTNCAIAADPYQPDAIDRLYAAKRRPRDTPLTLFVRDPERWRTYGRPDDDGVAEHVVETHWPGPPVVIVDATDRVTDDPALDDRVGLDGTVSIGCVANPVWRELTAHLDRPLSVTSANRSGTIDDDTLIDVATARDHVGDRVDLVIDADPPENATRATTIVDVANGPRIHRHGDLAATFDDLGGKDVSDPIDAD